MGFITLSNGEVIHGSNLPILNKDSKAYFLDLEQVPKFKNLIEEVAFYQNKIEEIQHRIRVILANEENKKLLNE